MLTLSICSTCSYACLRRARCSRIPTAKFSVSLSETVNGIFFADSGGFEGVFEGELRALDGSESWLHLSFKMVPLQAPSLNTSDLSSSLLIDVDEEVVKKALK